MTRTIRIGVLLASMLVASQSRAQATRTSEYLEVKLPQGVVLKIPRNWRVLTEDARITLDAASEALYRSLNAEHLPSSLPFAANYYDGAKVTAGMVNVRYYPDIEVTQSAVRKMSLRDVAAVDNELRQQLVRSVEANGQQLLEWRGTTTREISSRRFLVSEYRRSSATGKSFRVRLVRLLDAHRSFTITLSYREDEPVLRPITDYMLSSLTVRR